MHIVHVFYGVFIAVSLHTSYTVSAVSNDKLNDRLPEKRGLLRFRVTNGKLFIHAKSSRWFEIPSMTEVRKNEQKISNNRNAINWNKNKVNQVQSQLTNIVNKLSKLQNGLKTIWIRSDGFDDGGRRGGAGYATIEVDGKDYAMRKRGYNVVVLNPVTGNVESRASYDTHASAHAGHYFSTFLNNIASRRIVLVAIQDEASKRVTRSVYTALWRLGARNLIKHEYRSSFAFIGWSGPGKNSIVTQDQHHRHQGPSFVHKTFFVGV
ncbi:uncharacterized protein LOC114529999 [Dendronephthya gigantea]|uniref:uncharacterized protein LOC114529999 n=1 Tax=Dendronephthya gigantea TaxID=151771 RepID=UPI00106D892F|nr:uncharacterized protein LOC114529999 [Dendronephthya gigantea]